MHHYGASPKARQPSEGVASCRKRCCSRASIAHKTCRAAFISHFRALGAGKSLTRNRHLYTCFYVCWFIYSCICSFYSSIHFFTYLLMYWFIYSSVCLLLYLCIYLFVYLLINLSMYLFIHVSTYLSIYLIICLCRYTYMYVYSIGNHRRFRGRCSSTSEAETP